MSRALKAIGLTALATVALVALLGAWINGQGLPPDELARRCQESQPAWASYQEDVKAIHAPTVAKWSGHPQWVRTEDDTIRVSFALYGFWAQTETALPILLRTPEGKVVRNSTFAREDATVTYAFEQFPGTSRHLWIELHYPHTVRRFALDSDGQWHPDAD